MKNMYILYVKIDGFFPLRLIFAVCFLPHFEIHCMLFLGSDFSSL